MKKISIILFLPLLWGCAADTTEPHTGTLTVRLEVDDMTGGSATRGAIPAEEGETKVNKLTLLFFQYKPDGSGEFVKSVSLTDRPMNGRYEIGYDSKITETSEYTILAAANTDGYFTSDFVARFAGLTERQAIETTTAMVPGVVTDENYDVQIIEPSKLIMSRRVVRNSGEDEVTIDLKRGLARFDVENGVKGSYDLVSASIWGAAVESPLWHDRVTTDASRTERFYGIAPPDGSGDIRGGLYAFANYVPQPEPADKTTTCLILGLKSTSAESDKTTYYRVNVNVPGSAQNLERNHVYRVRIEEVRNTGADTEYGAWTSSSTALRVSIDGWGRDDGELIKTDGNHILILPVRRVNLDPKGSTLEYTIFTQGAGKPVISKTALPDGITAELVESRLTVTATALEGVAERSGFIELSFAGLRGTIDFTQSVSGHRFIELNRYEIPDFAPAGRTPIGDGIPFKVSASGPWTAFIHNISDATNNPGFSFAGTSGPVTILRSRDNPYGDTFQIFTTGPNPNTDKKRHGFMVVSLNEDHANIFRIVVLTQKEGS